MSSGLWFGMPLSSGALAVPPLAIQAIPFDETVTIECACDNWPAKFTHC
jgi:hypothetical protein